MVVAIWKPRKALVRRWELDDLYKSYGLKITDSTLQTRSDEPLVNTLKGLQWSLRKSSLASVLLGYMYEGDTVENTHFRMTT